MDRTVPEEAVVVPDCVEVEARLLRCVPRDRVLRNNAEEALLRLVDGPPRRSERPYPQFFERPYGPR